MKQTAITLDSFSGNYRKIAEVIGVEAALALAKYFGGLNISVPRLPWIERRERDKAIKEAYDHGVSVKALARSYQLTSRQIRNILKRP
jgi:Mor family transcriptional regulator